MRGDRTVAARTAERDHHLAAALLRDHDRIEPAAADMKRHATGLTDRMPDPSEQFGVSVHQPPGAGDASGLLVGENGQDQVARGSAAGLRPDQRRHHHRHAALHVERPAAPQVAVDDVAAEGPVPPLLVDCRDYVDMALQKQRRRFPTSLDARDQVGPSRLALVSSEIDVRVAQQALDVLDRDALLSGRVGGVKPDEVARELDHERHRRHGNQAS